ncbi:hypothetical protein SDC9_148710 [bioreactor metagenome]|uniref:Uncharacterized protein n=1 Tax=bioreactor metagenome TaxID=1076179 RepID=A0A645EHU0_9ZZZZ
MMQEQAEWFAFVALFIQPIEAQIRDDIGHIPVIFFVSAGRNKIRIIITPLSG